jgi:hypothetical protein
LIRTAYDKDNKANEKRFEDIVIPSISTKCTHIASVKLKNQSERDSSKHIIRETLSPSLYYPKTKLIFESSNTRKFDDVLPRNDDNSIYRSPQYNVDRDYSIKIANLGHIKYACNPEARLNSISEKYVKEMTRCIG